MNNKLHNTELAHHEAGNEFCPHCDRDELAYPVPCPCGAMVHREVFPQGNGVEKFVDICDGCGPVSEDADDIEI